MNFGELLLESGNVLQEGGVAGHLSHIYDNRNLTFKEMKHIFALASKGDLEGTEKTDGFNIFLTFRNGQAYAARNKGDIQRGGMTLQDLMARKFAGGDEVKSVFVEAFRTFENAVYTLEEEEIRNIFGPGGNVYYNVEIMGPAAQNVISYDTHVLGIHRSGHAFFDPESGEKVESVDVEQNSQFLDQVIDRLEKASQSEKFKVQRTAIINLKGITDKTYLKTAYHRIDKELQKYGLNVQNTIQDYLEASLHEKLGASGLFAKMPEWTLDLAVDSVTGVRNLRDIPKGTPREVRKFMSKYGSSKKHSRKLLSKAIWPIEDIVHDFSVQVLEGLESAYILDNKAELKRVKDELRKAINALKSYQGPAQEAAQKALAKQLAKIKHIDNVNTVAEGFVFEYGGYLYKFTGNFAPINQLLGIYKWGRGDIPALADLDDFSPDAELEDDENLEESDPTMMPIGRGSVPSQKHVKKNVVAVIPGGFKPPHAGHYGLVKEIADKQTAGGDYLVREVHVLISPKPRFAKDEDGNKIQITAEDSLKLWKLYAKNNPKIKPRIAKEASPVRATYAFLEEIQPNSIMVVAKSDKDSSDKRFAGLQKYADKVNEGVSIKAITVPELAEGISGTLMRKYILEGQEEEFKNNLPAHLTTQEQELAWQLVRDNQDQTMNDLAEYRHRTSEAFNAFKRDYDTPLEEVSRKAVDYLSQFIQGLGQYDKWAQQGLSFSNVFGDKTRLIEEYPKEFTGQTKEMIDLFYRNNPEYEVDVENNLVKKTYEYEIPAGPKQGEVIEKTDQVSINKFLNKSAEFIQEFVEYSEYYSQNYSRLMPEYSILLSFGSDVSGEVTQRELIGIADVDSKRRLRSELILDEEKNDAVVNYFRKKYSDEKYPPTIGEVRTYLESMEGSINEVYDLNYFKHVDFTNELNSVCAFIIGDAWSKRNSYYPSFWTEMKNTLGTQGKTGGRPTLIPIDLKESNLLADLFNDDDNLMDVVLERIIRPCMPRIANFVETTYQTKFKEIAEYAFIGRPDMLHHRLRTLEVSNYLHAKNDKAETELPQKYFRDLAKKKHKIESINDYWEKYGSKERESLKSESGTDKIIISRHPIDVVRMADFKQSNITSCHSEDSAHGYFKCAMGEAHGHAPIAYVVKGRDYASLVNQVSPQAEEFHDDEIFTDLDRDTGYITPISRLRFRKISMTVNQELGRSSYSFFVPEKRVYGMTKGSKFYDKMAKWSWDRQISEIMFREDVGSPNELFDVWTDPDTREAREVTSHGGTYHDTSTHDLIEYWLKANVGKDAHGMINWRIDKEYDPAEEESHLYTGANIEGVAEDLEDFIDHSFSSSELYYNNNYNTPNVNEEQIRFEAFFIDSDIISEWELSYSYSIDLALDLDIERFMSRSISTGEDSDFFMKDIDLEDEELSAKVWKIYKSVYEKYLQDTGVENDWKYTEDGYIKNNIFEFVEFKPVEKAIVMHFTGMIYNSYISISEDQRDTEDIVHYNISKEPFVEDFLSKYGNIKNYAKTEKDILQQIMQETDVIRVSNIQTEKDTLKFLRSTFKAEIIPKEMFGKHEFEFYYGLKQENIPALFFCGNSGVQSIALGQGGGYRIPPGHLEMLRAINNNYMDALYDMPTSELQSKYDLPSSDKKQISVNKYKLKDVIKFLFNGMGSVVERDYFRDDAESRDFKDSGKQLDLDSLNEQEKASTYIGNEDITVTIRPEARILDQVAKSNTGFNKNENIRKIDINLFFHVPLATLANKKKGKKVLNIIKEMEKNNFQSIYKEINEAIQTINRIVLEDVSLLIKSIKNVPDAARYYENIEEVIQKHKETSEGAGVPTYLYGFKWLKEFENYIQGGSPMSEDILDNREKPVDPTLIKKAMNYEMQNSKNNDLEAAYQVVMYNLSEDPNYYSSKIMETENDQLPGGFADDYTEDEFDERQLRIGTKVEMEHTNDQQKAREIAMDHLVEDPKYYDKLLDANLEEMSAAGAGAVAGHSGVAIKDKEYDND